MKAAEETVSEGYIAYSTMAETNYQGETNYPEATVFLIFAVRKGIEAEELNLSKNDDGTIDCTYGRFDWMNNGHGDPEESLEDVYLFEYKAGTEKRGEWVKAQNFFARVKARRAGKS